MHTTTRHDIARLLATAERAAALAASCDDAAECLAFTAAGTDALECAVLSATDDLAQRVQEIAASIGDRLIRAAGRFCCAYS
jgi:hypothetical protein